MDFKIVNTNYKMSEHSKEIIEKYNGEHLICFEEAKESNCWIGERDVYKIDFYCISDLTMFQNDLNEEVILYNNAYGITGEILEIYDSYRE